MLFNGYKYLVNTKRHETTYYQCPTYRTTQYKGKIIVRELSHVAKEVRETGEHTIDSVPTTTMRDCAEEMHLTLEKESVASSTVIPGRLWDRVSRELDAKYKGQAVRIMARDAVKNLIKYVWKQVHGGDEFRVIESASTVCVSESDERSFVHFNVFYDNNGKRQRIIGMGHPNQLCLLKSKGVSLFVDAAFSITPKPFEQTTIVMGHDSAFDVYIQVLYILTETKGE
ncbi:hypothetical protein DVH05_000905 [Phytophthora capsici]|nr:hypothetical protein DVH05_000905 [Phytophthora capsici]